MGIIFSAICCCSSCALTSASCCCATGRGASAMGRQAAKGSYVFLLGTGVLLSWVGQRFFEDAEFTIAQWDFICDGSDGNDVCSDDGFVYRMSFMMSIFFALMLIGNLPFPTLQGEQRWRPLLGNGFQNGVWALKIILFFGLLVVTLWLPSSFFDKNDNAWAWVCRIASSLFLILQTILLIDFGYQVNDDWVSRAYGEGGDTATSKGWLAGLLTLTVLFYGMAIGGLVALFVAYDECERGRTFTIITAIVSIVLTIITLFRDKLVGEPGAVFPTSVVVLYIVYLAWSATESVPETGCRPFDDGSELVVFAGIAFATVTLVWASYTASKRFSNLIAGADENEAPKENLGGLYAVGVDESGREIMARDKDASYQPTDESSNPNDALEDKPWLFHVFMITGAMYSAMLLTNWGVEDVASSDSNDAIGLTSMWVKIVSQWLAMGLYFWTLVAPKFLTSRDFSFYD